MPPPGGCFLLGGASSGGRVPPPWEVLPLWGGVLPPGGASSQGVLPLGGCFLWGVPPPWEVLPLGGGASSRRCLLPRGASSRGVTGGDPPGTATAADGTHPTGMHSYCFRYQKDRIPPHSLVVITN